jgi:hypothetical protein
MQALQPSAQIKGVSKKDGAPQEDDFINMDKGGRRHEGRWLSKETRSVPFVLPSNGICLASAMQHQGLGLAVPIMKSSPG